MKQHMNRSSGTPSARSVPDDDRDRAVLRKARLRALKIAGIYALCGFLWIALSDRLLASFLQDSLMLTQFQTYKGWAFIGVTAALVFELTRRAFLEPERQAAEIRQAEIRFRALFENVNVVALVIDPADGGILDANETAAAFYGWSREQLRSMSISQINTLTAAEVQVRMNEAMSQNRGCFLFSHRRADGSVRDVEVYSGPIPIEGKTALYSIIHDVTERKRAEKVLRESEQLLTLFIRRSPIYTYIKEVTPAESRVLYASENFQEMIGIPGSAMIGKTMAELFPPEFAAKITADDWAVVSGGQVIHFEEELNGRNYTTIKSPLVQGVRTLLVGYTIDITERKRAEEALRESEVRTRSIIESIPVGMHMYRLEAGGHLVFAGANPAADRILGVDNSIFVGKTIEEAFPPLAETEVPRRYREVVETGVAWQTESIEYRDGAIAGAFEVHAFRTGLDTMVAAFEVITERKRAEMAVRESEAKFRRLYNETPVMLHSIDRNAVLIDVNEHWLKVMGYERGEVIGRPVTDFYTPASAKYGLEVVQPAFFRDGIVKDVSYQFLKKNGDVIDVLLSSIGERNASGEVVRSQSVIEDITERKRAERELAQAERKFRMLFEYSSDPSLLIEGNLFIDCNQAAVSILGAKNKAEVLNTHPSELSPEMQPDGRPSRSRADEMIATAAQKGSHRFEWMHRRVTGEEFPVEVSLTLIRENSRTLLFTVWRDITERKRAEDALRQSEERFRNLAESLPLTVFEMDLQGLFTYVNRAAMEKFGYSRQEFDAGLNMAQMIAPGDRDRVREIMAGRLAGNADGYFEYQGLRKDGTTFPVTVASGPILRDGRPVGLRGIVSDLSERKQLEEELLKSQKLESVGTLAGGIAHDFNNLLQGIFGYISMAKLTIDQKEKSLAMLDQAEKAMRQSVSLTSQLLTFSKGGKPVKKALALQPVIEDAVKFALSGSRVNHTIFFADDLPMVEADEGQVMQVVQNIVLNADQAMPEGGTIKITARNVAAHGPGIPAGLTQGDYVSIAVQDSGVGIPGQYLTKIFDPYFSTKEKGSGLGLATSYSIIKNHGGVIEVSSVPGKGSTLTVYLPVSRAAQKSDAPSAAVGCAVGRTCRILVMDDEEMVRVVAGDLLRELGHETAFAEHGDAAIEKYRLAKAEGRPFDLVILDLTIRGGKGGAETLRELLKIDPGVKAVVSSGYSDDAETADYKAHGFRAFLKKPYDMRELVRVLGDVTA